jgi:hypothetical protein
MKHSTIGALLLAYTLTSKHLNWPVDSMDAVR